MLCHRLDAFCGQSGKDPRSNLSLSLAITRKPPSETDRPALKMHVDKAAREKSVTAKKRIVEGKKSDRLT